MVQKGNVMAAMDELVRNVIAPGVKCENMCHRGARVTKDVVAGDPSNGERSGNELVAQIDVPVELIAVALLLDRVRACRIRKLQRHRARIRTSQSNQVKAATTGMIDILSAFSGLPNPSLAPTPTSTLWFLA